LDCQEDYITLSKSVRPSRSGLYADLLPGIDTEMIDCLAREVTGTHDDIWPTIYERAWSNMVSDISKSLQAKMFVNYKLLSRETSGYKSDENQNPGIAGVKLDFFLPKYGILHVVKIQVFSEISYGSPGITFRFYDTDQNGELLFEKTDSVAVGRSDITIDQDFSVDSLFICYETAQADLKQTENRFYRTGYLSFGEIFCDFCLWGDQFYRGSVTQVNGGGINAFYNVRCSTDKYVCENINLYAKSLLWKIGEEITNERRIGERLTKFTTFTIERAQELSDYYGAQYSQELENSIKSLNIQEDPVCFQCKQTVYVATSLP